MSPTRLDASSRAGRPAGGTSVPAQPAVQASVQAAAPAVVPAAAPVGLCVRQRALQWGYLVAWFGLLFVASPFLLRPEDWREKLWLTAAFLCLVVFGHVRTYTAVHTDGLSLGRWLRRTTIPWSSVTGIEVTGRWIRRVYVVCADGTAVLPAPTSGPLNWDGRFPARAAAVQAAVRQATRPAAAAEDASEAAGEAAKEAAGEAARQSLSPESDNPVPIPRPRTPAE